MNAFQAILFGAVVAAAGSTVRAQTPVRVTANGVNLRARALPTSEVVAQAAYDDRLVAYELGDEWVEVAAPPAAALWVAKSFVQAPANTIGANRVNVRAGPGINYNVVCVLALGDVVAPRGEEIQEWLKIAPPAAARLWISRQYVEILAPDAAASNQVAAATEPAAGPDPAAKKTARRKKSAGREETPRPAPAAPTPAADLPTPIVSASVPETHVPGRAAGPAPREIPVPPPADLKLIPLEGQGRFTEVEGELRAAPLINEAPTRYRVVRWQDNRWQILCHVYGAAAKFRSLQDRRVHLKGREYWIQGAAAPVLVPDQVQEIPAARDAPR